MKKLFWVFFLTLLPGVIFLPQNVSANDDPEAVAIMKKVNERKSGKNAINEMEMILIDKNKKQRIKKLINYNKNTGEDTFSVSFFLHPADVKGTGFLSRKYQDPNKDDDQWLYIPALKKTKRISSSGKGGSFMGSDFTYADMGSRKLDDYYYTFYKKKEKSVRGKRCWVLYAMPRSQEVIDKTGYTKSILFVRQDNNYVIRGMFYMKEEGYIKYMDIKKLELIDDIWVAKEMHMTKKLNKKLEHKTILKNNRTKFNQDLSDDLFTIRRLEKGP